MPVVPVLPPVAAGVLPTSTLAAVVAATAFLLNPPVFEARQTAAQSFTTAVGAAFTWAAPDVDSVVGWSAGSPSRYTFVYPGRYLLNGGASWAPNATGLRECFWSVNGAAVLGSLVQVSATSTSGIAIPARGKSVLVAIGDYVELFGLQTSGGALNSSVSASDQPHITIKFVGTS